MTPRKIATNTRAEHLRIGIVLSRFNAAIGQPLLEGALRALGEAGARDSSITVVTVPGALEAPLALQRMAQSGDYDALVALGAVIRGETFHFDIVATESASDWRAFNSSSASPSATASSPPIPRNRRLHGPASRVTRRR